MFAKVDQYKKLHPFNPWKPLIMIYFFGGVERWMLQKMSAYTSGAHKLALIRAALIQYYWSFFEEFHKRQRNKCIFVY